MQAYPITRYGEPDFFTEMELPTPRPGPGQVLVEVAATSVNPVDTKIRAGGRAMCPDLPAVLHMDVAGTVVELGEGVASLRPGDAIYGCAGGLKTVAGENLGGALAQFMAVDAELVAPKPATLSMVEAAVLPLVTITAWEALFDRAHVGPGMRVLVHAAAGGVGHVAVQLARHAGADVVATVSSAHKAAIARELGAAPVDYRQRDVGDYVAEHTDGRGFDVVLDTVGGDNLPRSLVAARVGGTVVTILAQGRHDLAELHMKGLSLHAVFMLIPMLHGVGRGRHGEILRDAARLVDEGRLRPLIDPQRFAFAEAGAAHRKLESGAAVGKIVLER